MWKSNFAALLTYAHPTHWLISTQVMDDADRAFIDNTDETDENKAILAEYAKEKQNFAGDRPGGADDFEADEKRSRVGPTTRTTR